MATPESEVARITAVVPSCSCWLTATLDAGEVVFGQFDAFDGADRRAADQDLVFGDELARVLEEQVVLVSAAAAEQHDAERDHHDRKGPDRGNPGGSEPPAGRRAFLLA